MADDTPRTTARVVGNPLYPLLAAIPFTCFTGALLTDIAYWRTASMQWTNFSAWLLAVGLFVAVFAVLAGLVDFVADRRIREQGIAWAYAGGNALAIVLAIFNSFVHSRDAFSSVWPEGLILSALTVIIMLITGWMGWSLVYHHRVIVLEGRS